MSEMKSFKVQGRIQMDLIVELDVNAQSKEEAIEDAYDRTLQEASSFSDSWRSFRDSADATEITEENNG